MTDKPENPFEDLMKMGQDWAQNMAGSFDAEAVEKMWPTMPKEVMEAFMGKGVNPDGLDAKTRLLLTLAGLTCQGAQADTALRQTVRHALEAGAHKQEIVETITQMSVFAGMPAVTRALALAQGVVDETEDDQS